MEDIVTKDNYYQYRWQPGFKDIIFGKEGCEACDLYNNEYCPKDKCTKDGVYFIMHEWDRTFENLHKLIKEQNPDFDK